MITIFNRKRLFSSFSVKAQASLREALAAHKIPYIVNAVNIPAALVAPTFERLQERGPEPGLCL